MSPIAIVVALVALQRLAELAYAARNTRKLLARGAVEHGRSHYPLLVVLHGAWLLAILVTVPREATIDWYWLTPFIMAQGFRLWIVASLGPYWTTRVISMPGVPLVRRGPYRLLRHPNYCVVVAEIALLPLVFHAWVLAIIFSALNLAVLGWRIRIEERALAPRRAIG